MPRSRQSWCDPEPLGAKGLPAGVNGRSRSTGLWRSVHSAPVEAASHDPWTGGGLPSQTFDADSAIGVIVDEEILVDPGAENVDAAEASGITTQPGIRARGPAADPPELERQDLITVGPMIRTCPCTKPKPEDLFVDDIRDISDRWVADGDQLSNTGLSNMVWSFGQFVDHDLTLTLEDEEGPSVEVDTELDVMEIFKAITIDRRGCKNQLNVHTPLIDAGPIYGSDRTYLQQTLRLPGTCRMRTAEGDFLPITTSANENGQFTMLAGDVRVSEHAFLAAQHTVWVREHNRICDIVESTPSLDRLSGDQKFARVQNIVIAKFQQVILTEFLPALGITQADLEAADELSTANGVSVEFSIAYRLGHDLIGNTVGDMPVAEAFDSEGFFLDFSGPDNAPSVTYKPNANELISKIMFDLAGSSANEIDGRLSNALRNLLFGADEGEDLAGRNIFRGRELGLPSYAGLARCYGTTADPQVEEETPDAWLGLLREPKAAGEALPATLRAIIVEQFHKSFFGRRGRYWRDLPGRVRPFQAEIEATTYADIISANTGARVTGNVFKV